MDTSLVGITDPGADWDLGGIWQSARSFNAGIGLGEQRTAETIPTNAVSSMTPVAPAGAGDSWSGWLAQVAGTITNTELARYVNRRTQADSPVTPLPQSQVRPAAASGIPTGWLLVGGVLVAGVVAVLALRKG